MRMEVKSTGNALWLTLITSLLFFLPLISMAQQEEEGLSPEEKEAQRFERIEAKKIGFLTSRLELTPEEAQKFWPIYNQYEAEMKAIYEKRISAHNQPKDNFDSMTDKEVEKLVDDEIALNQEMLDVKKKYHSQFKSILPIKKVAKLYHSEDMFKRMLLREIGGRGGPGHGPGDHHDHERGRGGHHPERE
ncbi:MAG: hypothetical protein KDD36_15015 [Flavobacteriales bacterium]|nr:hypothetical protein [Flavobacteriales bacterium]